MTAPGSTSYDAVPYISEPFRQTHPNNLAAVAHLLGLQPPAVDDCRVLELGCASGGNLTPLAFSLPRSRLVGVDYSVIQIAEGRRTVDALGLKNVSLLPISILDIGPELGTFDYIIAHGVFSWVPDAVRDKLLEVVGRQLAPNGVAFVSYNVLPGWHVQRTLRDVLLYHGRRFADPAAKIHQARAMLQFLADFTRDETDPYRQFLRAEVAGVQKLADSYLFHDQLEDHNTAYYFHEFVELLKPHGLRYLGEADFHAMILENFEPPVQQVVRHLAADALEVEQYMDFLRNRTFRQTLLCRADHTPDWRIGPERLRPLRVASRGRPLADAAALRSGEPVDFENPAGQSITLTDPFLKSAFGVLAAEWPVSIPFDELCRRARAAVPPGNDSDTAAADAVRLAGALMQLYSRSSIDWIELSLAAPVACRQAGERPLASPLARRQAASGATVTTLRHETVRLDELARGILLLLDGSRDRPQLLEALAELRRLNRLPLPTPPEGLEASSPERWLAECLDGTLRELGRSALLLA